MRLSTNPAWMHINEVFEALQDSQWTHTPNFSALEHYELLTKSKLRELSMDGDFFYTSTSGSTGEPVTVGKSYEEAVWQNALKLRQHQWLNWDVTKNLAVISFRYTGDPVEIPTWELPYNIAQVQGSSYIHGNAPIHKIQQWVEKVNPHYVVGVSGIINELDFSNVPNFLDAKGYGGAGSKSYSTEECGIIALTCPNNPKVFHVMENILVEVTETSEAVVTVLNSKYIKRYLLGDIIELGSCDCGRTLQTITSIKGRTRNLLVLPDGSKIFPLVGSKMFYSKFGIKQYQAVQTSVDNLDMYIVSEPVDEEDLKKLILEWLTVDMNICIKYVEGFSYYKHEEFISLV